MGNEAKYKLTAVDKTKAAVQSASKGFGSVDKVVGRLGAGLGALAGGVAIKKFVDQVKASASSMDDIAKSANRLGVAVETLDSMNFAAELAGASAADLETIYKRGARSIVDAADGLGEGAKAFERLGIEARDSEGNVKSVDSVILEFADKLPRLQSETELTATAMQLFGRSGQQLIPMLRQGKDAIRAQMIEARVLGARTGDMTRKGEDFVDAQLRLNRSLRATKDAIAVEVLPSLSALSEFIAEKVIKTITGLDREYRVFLATLALETPNSAFKILTEEAHSLETQIAEARIERDRLLEDNKSKGGILGNQGDAIATNAALDEMLTKLAAVREELANTEARKELQAQTEERLKAARAWEEQQKFLQQVDEDMKEGLADWSESLEEFEGAWSGVWGNAIEEIEDVPEAIGVAHDHSIRFFQNMKRAGEQFAGSLEAEMSGAFSAVLAGNMSVVEAFTQAWLQAIQRIAAEMAAKLVIKTAASFIPGLGFLVGKQGSPDVGKQQLNKGGVGPGSTDFVGAGTVGSGGNITMQFVMAAPPSTADYITADRRARQAARQHQRFALGGA